MRWKDLRQGDVMIDASFEGNDHILVARDGELGTWIRVQTGEVEQDLDSPLDSKEIHDDWLVIRYEEVVHP